MRGTCEPLGTGPQPGHPATPAPQPGTDGAGVHPWLISSPRVLQQNIVQAPMATRPQCPEAHGDRKRLLLLQEGLGSATAAGVMAQPCLRPLRSDLLSPGSFEQFPWKLHRTSVQSQSGPGEAVQGTPSPGAWERGRAAAGDGLHPS